MSVKVRPHKKRGKVNGWEVDIQIVTPDGSMKRERRKAPVSSKSAALRWGQARERELLIHVPEKERKEVPTLRKFAPRFIEGYAIANRHKPSGIAAKETVLRVHLVPRLGSKKLDAISNEDVQQLKVKLGKKSPKTVNNVLTALNKLLKVAVEWGVIEQMPCSITLLPVPQNEAAFHDFEEYQRLLDAAKKVDERAYLVVLLGGEAGLRCGEIMALEWKDLDLEKRQLKVQRSEWKGKVTVPKGGRPRVLPMTKRLAGALKAHQHLRGPRVLYQDDGESFSQKVVRNLVLKAARRANLARGTVHILRHTFCSHLAMRGAPARAIQELAGHKDLKTTQRYMHLSPAAVESAIRLLEQPAPGSGFGAILEPPQSREGELNKIN
jgi:integrase